MTARIAALVLAAFVTSAQAEAPWPQFRGPGGRGIAPGDALPPDRWSTTDNVSWNRDIPGRGWSSPIVAGDRVILTTVVNTDETEAAKKGPYFGGERAEPATTVHQWKVVCLDLATGAVLWEKQVHEGVPATPIHIKSSYASETPVTDGRHVWCMFGSLGIWCLDLEGTVVWNRPLPPRAMRFGWGAAASPALHEERLFVVDDNEEQSEIVALDAATGRELWKAPHDEKRNDLDGNLLWSLEGMSSITIATPFEADRLLYVTSGYVLDPRKPIYCINPGATGDISLDAGAEFKILHTIALAGDDMGMASPAIVGQRLLLRTAARIDCIAPQGTAAVVPAGAPDG